MFDVFAELGDRLRHFLLNPPLAPGGVGNGGVSTAEIGDDDSINNDPLILRYLPLLVLLTLFWPVLFTLIAASVSASAWLFWLCVGIIFGVIQLLYVVYNFAMIVWDMTVLVALKTIAMLRSLGRYYFLKVGDAAGYDMKGKRHGKRRTRKEWREEVNISTSYNEYCKIELYEPRKQQAATITASPSKTNLRRGASVGSEKGTSAWPTGLRLRKRRGTDSPTKQTLKSPASPSRATTSTVNNSQMRKTYSSNELNKSPKGRSPTRRVFRNSTTFNGNDSDSPRPLRRVSSAFPLNKSNDEEDDFDGDESQQVIHEDLGMTGDMLLTTSSRLKEARMQASKINVQSKPTNKDVDDNDFILSMSEADQVEMPSFHITSFSTPSKGLPRHEDYSSSLKTLLSGIVKRNHLSIDDFLMNDARSVAERGQHSLRRETREAIDRYGEEVERSMEWLASGPVYLGGNIDGMKSNTPELVMQKQRDELSKRYTLFKRMKQNFGHTALMLSGGGAQAMYHLGTIKALIESGQYEKIHVISGTSGGRYVVAICIWRRLFFISTTHCDFSHYLIKYLTQYCCRYDCNQNAG